MTPGRAAFWVAFLALTAYGNSLGNGFAYDDEGIITQNPVVLEGNWNAALKGTWWPDPVKGAGLYRPLTLASFVGEWRLFGGAPLGFHAVNVLCHALVALLALLLLLQLGSVPGALAGGVVFAVHPLHTEAVANVVGRAELFSAAFYLLACLLYLRGREWSGSARVIRLLGLGLLYLLALCGKEIAVTLPGALLLLEYFDSRGQRAGGGSEIGFFPRVLAEFPTFLLMGAVLGAYLGLRFLAMGTVLGELPAPLFVTIGSGARVMTAMALWIHYLRLLLFPLDLASDYDPGVLFPSEGPDAAVILGTLVLAAWMVTAVRIRTRLPLVSLGLFWFALVVLPVSNLFFPTGVLLAERTLYLPSLGLSFVVAGLWEEFQSLRHRLFVAAFLIVWTVGSFTRTVLRNPSWMSTFVVMVVLNEEHPESWRAIRAQAQGLQRVQATAEAADAWDLAVRLAPHNYTLLVQAGDFHCRQGSWSRCESYLREAVRIHPGYRNAYQLLAGAMIRSGFGREGHRIALEGLRRAGTDRELWALVSESYILKDDLPAAARAREAAIGADPASDYQWARLGDILEAMEETQRAARVREVADSLAAISRGGDP